MSIPSPWAFALLTLAAFRTWRLLAIDTFPLVEKLRNRVIWKGPIGDQRIRFSLAEFLKCPYCLGAWVTLGWWGAWLAWPQGTVVAAVPFALSAAIGTWATRLDP